MEHEDNGLLDLIEKTAAFDREESTPIEKGADLTFKRDENGNLWSYDATTGEKVGRIFEHGDSQIDKITEV
jgi:hypothetical protein